MEPPTIRAMLLLLYGAGLRRSEVLNLSVADVDLPNGLLTIRSAKFFKSRLVPIGLHLAKVLSDYARWQKAAHPSADAVSHFFVSRLGTEIRRWTLEDASRGFGRPMNRARA